MKLVGDNSTGGFSEGLNRLKGVFILLTAVAIVFFFVPRYLRAREMAKRNICINNLKYMANTQAGWALEAKKVKSDQVDVARVQSYLGGVLPKCPDGGTYQFTVVGKWPTCSIPGHVLPSGYDPYAPGTSFDPSVRPTDSHER